MIKVYRTLFLFFVKHFEAQKNSAITKAEFIFAIIAEESGFIGCLCVILLYFLLFKYVFILSTQCKDLFGSLLCIGIISMIGIQTLINLGVVVGLLPITGVTLPLISYGGTSLVVTLASIGIILNIANILVQIFR